MDGFSAIFGFIMEFLSDFLIESEFGHCLLALIMLCFIAELFRYIVTGKRGV